MWHNDLERINNGLGEIVGRFHVSNRIPELVIEGGRPAVPPFPEEVPSQGSFFGNSFSDWANNPAFSGTGSDSGFGGSPGGFGLGPGTPATTTVAPPAVALGPDVPLAVPPVAGATPTIFPTVAGGGAGLFTTETFTALLKKYGVKGAMAIMAQQQKIGGGPGGSVDGLTGDAATAQDKATQILLDMLFGETDKRQFNSQLAGISRSGQQNTTDIRSELARSGVGGLNSGVAQAILGASGQATAQRQADFTADEAQKERDRKKEAVDLFLDLIVGPHLQQQGIEAGLSIETNRNKNARDAANQDFWAKLLGFGADYAASR